MRLKTGEYIELSDFEASKSPPPYDGATSTTVGVSSKPSWRRQHLTGWRFGVVSCAASAGCVFLINVSVTLWASQRLGITEGRGILFEGNCARSRPYSTAIHVVINILSTLLLSASNYCMQCLSAPTRKEIDTAHSQNKWVDIGVPSIKNLRRISGRKTLLWCILGSSSLPLHLFYNSAVFSSISSYSYDVFEVNESFLGVDDFSTLNVSSLEPINSLLRELKALHQAQLSQKLERLTPEACIDAYALGFQSARGSVFVVVDDSVTAGNLNQTGTLVSVAFSVTGSGQDCPDTTYDWICSSYDFGKPNDSSSCAGSCGDHTSEISGDWKPFGNKVKYCLSQRLPEHCKLQFSLHIALLVIILNLLKATVMLILAFGVKERPLMTMGDAVSSFLQQPDPTTENMCLLSKSDVHYQRRKDWAPLSKIYDHNRRMWFCAASVRRWVVFATMYLAALGLCSCLLWFGIFSMSNYAPTDFASLWSLGLGAITPVTFISWSIPSDGALGLIENVLMANLAQPILSFLYFMLNGLFTCMLLSNEWDKFATRRKGLRVSDIPIGAQRTSYTLQLPYRYAIPLMAASGCLHWLVSQSIFIVNVEALELDSDQWSSYMSCGYSPIAIIGVIVVGGLLVLVTLGMGFRRFRTGMPVAGSCSMAISAACHAYKHDGEGGAFDCVEWGDTGDCVDGVRHCAFSKDPVEEPSYGQIYA